MLFGYIFIKNWSQGLLKSRFNFFRCPKSRVNSFFLEGLPNCLVRLSHAAKWENWLQCRTSNIFECLQKVQLQVAKASLVFQSRFLNFKKLSALFLESCLYNEIGVFAKVIDSIVTSRIWIHYQSGHVISAAMEVNIKYADTRADTHGWKYSSDLKSFNVFHKILEFANVEEWLDFSLKKYTKISLTYQIVRK